VKITADTNVLLRTLVNDNEEQAARAVDVLTSADMVAISLQTLCEISWVLNVSYGVTRINISAAIRALVNTSNVVTNRAAAEAGLALLEAGGDFADGVIAFDGAWLGAETFVSFDKKAVQLLKASGHQCKLLV
jgi:predicted nucleic-acid-binding protein